MFVKMPQSPKSCDFGKLLYSSNLDIAISAFFFVRYDRVNLELDFLMNIGKNHSGSWLKEKLLRVLPLHVMKQDNDIVLSTRLISKVMSGDSGCYLCCVIKLVYIIALMPLCSGGTRNYT